MKLSYKGLLVLAIVAGVSYFASEKTEQILPPTQRLLGYTTTLTRTDNVNKNCPANLDRTTLVSTSDFSDAQSMRTTVNSNLGIDGNSLISTIINGNMSAGITMLMNSVTPFAMYVGSFLIAFILIFIMWPFLCCCCTCPYCCPSKCCQKAEDEQYSKCELYWPTTVLVLSLLLIISASVYGFMKVSSFGPAFTNLGCSTSIFVDDVLNGNVTSSGTSFFTGLNTLYNQLTNLDGNLSFIDSKLTDLNTTSSSKSYDALSYVTTSMTNVQKIPDTASPYVLNLKYPNPIDTAYSPAPTLSVDSLFKDVLGSYSNSNSLVGGLYTLLKTISDLITNARSNAATFKSNLSSVNSAVASIKNSISSIISSVTKMDSSIGGPIGMLGTVGQNGNMGLQAFYGVFIGFASLALLGTLLTACCDKYGCRHLIYFSCLIMFLVGLIGALLSTLFSILIPAFTWGCSYFDTTLGSQVGFTTNLGGVLGSAATQLAPCMPFGDGNIVSSIATGTSLNALNSVKDIFSTMGSFNNTQLQSWISGNLTTFENTINSWVYGQVLDVNESNLIALNNLSNPSLYTGCSAAFAADSWVPTNSPNTSISSSYITCKATSGLKGDSSTCDSNIAGTNCKGCMDASSINTITGVDITQLGTKYGAIGTCGFTGPMTNVWYNYYQARRTVLGNVNSVAANNNVRGRMLTAKAKILASTTGSGGVFEALDLMNSLFTSINTNLASIKDLTDPNYGLLAGLNCKIFGEDFQRIENILCGSLYSNVYTMRLAFGIIAYGVLFMMCCAVCTGVRHFKHMQRKEKIGDAFFKNSFDEASGQAFKRKE